MKRKIEEQLLSWKKSKDRKPLIINGARQVGKTYILREFGEKYYDNIIYVNLEINKAVSSFFDDDITPKKLIKYLEATFSEKINPATTLIFLDEIQSCERAVTSLKYFYEDSPEYHIVAAGSLLGVAINRENFSFPVGKVETLQLFPLDFEEFLLAKEQENLIEIIKECYNSNTPMPEALHKKSVELYKDYIIVGGMPASVNKFCKTNSYIDSFVIQAEIINNYTADMAKYATNTEAIKIRACYNSIPVQLAKENKKFQYKVVKKGGSAAIFGESIDWLKQAGVIIECKRIYEGNEPLTAYTDLSAFKIYMSDVGLLTTASGMSYQTIVSGEPNIFMGAITENYVSQQLTAKGYTSYYWSRENSQAELDFVIQKENKIIAIEVKKGEKVKSRSLTMFINQYSPTEAIRFSLKNFGEGNDIKAVPLYAIFCI